MEFPLDSGGSVTVSSLYGRDTNLIDKRGVVDDLDSAYENSVTWLRWRGPEDDRLSVEAMPYVGHASGARAEGETDWDNRDLTYVGARGVARVAAGSAHSMEAGVELRAASGVYDYRETISPFPELSDSPDRIDVTADVGGLDASVYGQDEWRLSDRAGAVYGMRAHWQSYRPGLALSPRGAVAVRFLPGTTWRVGMGSVAQPVGPSNVPVESGVGDATAPERAAHLVVGMETTSGPRLSVRVEAYYKGLSDLTGRDRDIGRKSQYYRVSGSGTAYGWELFARGRPGSAASWTAGYAYAVSERNDGDATYPSDFDRRHATLFNASADVTESATLTAAWRFHTGTPVSPAHFVRDDEGRVTSASVGLPDDGVRTPPFHSLDVRLTKAYRFATWSMTAYLQVTNAYARDNVQEYSYDAAMGYVRVEENFLPVTPTFGLTARF
jgi:hypothetical protein